MNIDIELLQKVAKQEYENYKEKGGTYDYEGYLLILLREYRMRADDYKKKIDQSKDIIEFFDECCEMEDFINWKLEKNGKE